MVEVLRAAAGAQGVHGGVLEEEEAVAAAARGHVVVDPPLERVGLAVREGPEPDRVEGITFHGRW